MIFQTLSKTFLTDNPILNADFPEEIFLKKFSVMKKPMNL